MIDRRQTSNSRFLLTLLCILALAPAQVKAQEDDEGKAAGNRYAAGSRRLESRIIVQDDRYLKGVIDIQVDAALLKGFEPDFIEVYLDGEMVAIDYEPPFTARIDVGPTTRKASVLIVATRDRAVEPTKATSEAATAADADEQGRLQQAAGFRVEIVYPQNGTYVSGRTPITVEADLPVGGRLESVQFYVDDELVGTADSEPWELVYDFGRKFNSRSIGVQAFDNLGRRATARITTLPLERSAFFIETKVVTLDVTVTDDRGKFAGGLAADDFEVYENGRLQEVRYFSNEERPLWVAVLVDTSGSMAGAKIRRSVFAAQQFISQLKPADQAMVVTFGPEVTVVSEFTNDYTLLIDRLGGVDAERNAQTPLNKAMFDTLEYFKERAGRRAVIVISDGADTAGGVMPDQVEQAARQSEVHIYGIGIRSIGIEGGIGGLDDAGAILLRGVSDITGGECYFPTSTGEFLEIFKTIADELRSQYSIGYVAPKAADNNWREVEVKVKKRGLAARTSKGYYPES